MHERELQRSTGNDLEGRADRDVSPGRATRSSSLASPTAPIVSGLIQRKAERDGNGVSTDADSAVAAASSSAGTALPTTLMRQFESSLGTDLSSVRVHTGSESAAAAHAVGAKAYTLGNDVHFGAGHYDPVSTTGQHLIAHEVAHTVQQRGSHRSRQYKLEVSTPGDEFELEADRAADAMVRGDQTRVASGMGPRVSRDADVTFTDQHEDPSAQMRSDGEQGVNDHRTTTEKDREERHRQNPAARSDGGTVSADHWQADIYLGRIDSARGPLGELQGREDAINDEWRTGGKQVNFVGYNEAAKAIAANNLATTKLHQFKTASGRQDFQDTLFTPAYETLKEDFIRLKASIDVIKAHDLKLTGEDAKSDVRDAKRDNPLLGDAISNLKSAITELRTTASSATAGLSATADTAASTFDALGTATEKLKLPLPDLEDSDEEAEARAVVAQVNADLDNAKAAIGSIKSVVTAAIAVATGGAGAAMTEFNLETIVVGAIDGQLENYNVKGAADTMKNEGGAAAGAVKTAAAGKAGLEGQVAAWVTNYNGRIAAANGKLAALNAKIKEAQLRIATSEVTNLQGQLAKEIGRFALLMKQVGEKKAAVLDAAKKVREEASKKGKRGTDIGAAAQAMADVSNFMVQADETEALGSREKQHGDEAKNHLRNVAGDYRDARTDDGGIAETMPLDAEEACYYECKVAGDAAHRGKFDLSGYDVQRSTIIFTINEGDVDERSRVMSDRTDAKLKKIAQWKAEAHGFETALANVLGMGPSTIK